MMEPKEIVAQEVARQKEFGYEPSWEDFVIAGMDEGKKQERERIKGYIETYGLSATYIARPDIECIGISKFELQALNMI